MILKIIRLRLEELENHFKMTAFVSQKAGIGYTFSLILAGF